MIKRGFDVIISIFGIIALFPLFLVVSLIIKLNSKGPILFKQARVGKNNKEFILYKFRSMQINSEKEGLLTIGNNDSRTTKVGRFLRKYKIDEFPQLLNIVKGDMSFVGPRPELRHFVNYYHTNDLTILDVKPGITGLASLNYRNESELLKKAKNPEEFYIKKIIPSKLNYNKTYLKKKSFAFDMKLILLTIYNIFKN